MMLLLNPEDPLELTWVKIKIANLQYYMDTHSGHRVELDRAIGECFKRWDELTNTKGAV